jgi:hypothetical protein
MKSEKAAEFYLNELLKPFPKSYIFNAPTENADLKRGFSLASKTGGGRGIPDRIYYDEKTLIVFECKKDDLKKALKDLKIYRATIIKDLALKEKDIYFVGVIPDAYEIYDVQLNKLEIKLSPENFNIAINLSLIHI